jgi:mRNA-degrading endonuclease toxin of MazEF toxin-antitoxin module
VSVGRGSLLSVDLDPVVGHEQQGRRPCVVLTPAALAVDQRYALLIVVPFTGTTNLGALYPIVQPYQRGLSKPSAALVDQVRAIDKRRVVSQFAAIPAEAMRRIDEALKRVLGL